MIEPLSTIEPLERAIARLEEERALLDRALLDRIPHGLRGRVGEIAADITDGVRHQMLPAVAGLLAEHDRVSRVLARQLAGLFAPELPVPALMDGESEEPFARDGSYERLRLAFKLLFMTVRSMQDALNVCCLWLAHGGRPNAQKASMAYTVGHLQSEVGRVLADELPEYAAWFARWRKQRNRVKNGTGFGTFILDGDAGIQFTRLTDENVYLVDLFVSRVGLSDVTEAVNQTCDLMRLVRERAGG